MPSYRADIAKVVIGDAAAAPAAAPAAEAAPAAAPAGGAALPDSATPVFMPALSSTMTEGKIVQWTKNEGDKVSAGEIHSRSKARMRTLSVDSATPRNTEQHPKNFPAAAGVLL